MPAEDDGEENNEVADGANNSSSEDNDSTAAAHAAAIGHSPRLVKVAHTLPDIPDHLKQGPDAVSTISTTTTLQPKPSHIRRDIDMKDTNHHTSIDEKINSVRFADNHASRSADGPCLTKAEADTGETPPVSGLHKRTKLVVNPDVFLNERDEDENTALHIAIHSRKLEHTKVLLEAGASLRIRCDGSLPLHTAISMGSLRNHAQFAYECVVLLKEHGADLSVKDESMQTPLFLACMFNLPQIAEFILSDDVGLGTLNCRSDRAGNRPLHAAAKFDTPENTTFSKRAASIATGQSLIQSNRANSPKEFSKDAVASPKIDKSSGLPQRPTAVSTPTTEALLTQILLGVSGIEVDAVNSSGHTPLHVACMRRNWPVVRLLLQTGASATAVDKRGYTPGQLAYKRGAPVPKDLVAPLGDPPDIGIIPPLRELVVDPDGSTAILCHELCIKHHTCTPMRRDSEEPPPENIRRLRVLLDQDTGILRSGEFARLVWIKQARRAAIADVLKVWWQFIDYPTPSYTFFYSGPRVQLR